MRKQKGSFQNFIWWAGEHIWLVTIALFLLSFIIRLYYSFWTGPMVQAAYPDETRFFDIARSLAGEGQIFVRGIPADFQKILYSIIIAPSFILTGDQLTQMNIIRVINCLTISSVVFPVTLLAKKLSSSKTVILIVLLVTITLPDMAYSASFLSEVLYMPLVIWLFYFVYIALAEQTKPKRMFYFGILGFLTYLVYLTKEIGAAFIIAAIILLVIDTIQVRQRIVQNLLSALSLSIAFFAVFFVMKLTLFQDMGNTYALSNINVNDQISLSALSSPDVFFYLVYSSIALFIAGILSFYTAPVFFTLYGYGSMNEENKKIYLFTCFSLLIMIGAIAYTISIREDLGESVPRLHMRYIMPLVIPVMIQCLDLLFSGKLFKRNALTAAYPIILTLSCIAIIILIPHVPEPGYLLDHYTLKITYHLESMIISIGPVTINIAFVLFKLLLVALTVYGSLFIIRKKQLKPVIVILLCVIFIINAYDNFMSYTSIRRLKTSDFSQVSSSGPATSHLQLAFSKENLRFSYDIVNTIIATNDHLKSLDGTVIVFLDTSLAPYTDTYLDTKAFPVQAGELYKLALQNGGALRMDEQPIWEGNRYNTGVMGLDTWKRGFYSADYIITFADDHPFVNVLVEFEKWPLAILRNIDPDIIYIVP